LSTSRSGTAFRRTQYAQSEPEKAVAIAERKQRLMSIFANVAEISAERMEELAGQASLRDAGTTAWHRHRQTAIA
jgi:hypothetical protein